MELQENTLRDIEQTISHTLELTSDEIKILNLKGLRAKINIGWKEVRLQKDGKYLFDSSEIRVKRNFFFQDYILINNFDEYLLQTFTYRAFFIEKCKNIEDTLQKRSYMLCIVIENEIARLRLQQKHKWHGKTHTVVTPYPITPEQEKIILDIITEYNFFDNFSHFTIMQHVMNYNLSCLYLPKQTKQVCSLLREITNILGDEWGERATLYTTNGKKTLKQIKKCYKTKNED